MEEESYGFIELWIKRVKKQLMDIEELSDKRIKSWRDLKKKSKTKK